MQAMHGFAKLRARGRLIGCCAVLTMALGALVIAPAAANAVAPPTTTYLALGDSISFGYTAEKFALHQPNESPSYFEEGFTNYFTYQLKKATELGKSIRLVNDGCPGETSNGLIGENEAIGGQKSTEGPEGIQGVGDWHPCRYHFVNGLPLHNSLGTTSQLEDALAVLGAENGSGGKGKVEAISLQIGSNDELAGIEACKKEVGEEFGSKFFSVQPNSKSAPGDPEDGTKVYALNGNPAHDQAEEAEAFKQCLQGHAFYVIIPNVAKNIVTTAKVIDEAGGFTGPIVVMGFYNPQAFLLKGSDALQNIVNFEVKKALEGSGLTNIHWADVMTKFNAVGKGPIAEKKAIAKYTEMCNPNVQKPETGADPGCEGDIHPSLAGYKLMAKLMNEAYLAPAIP
jgi:lysophospholipase L1-like esterase